MIDALKRHPQCEDVYRCLVFKEIRILYIKDPSPKGFVFTRRRRRTTTTMWSSLRATFATRDAAKNNTLILAWRSHFVFIMLKRCCVRCIILRTYRLYEPCFTACTHSSGLLFRLLWFVFCPMARTSQKLVCVLRVVYGPPHVFNSAMNMALKRVLGQIMGLVVV